MNDFLGSLSIIQFVIENHFSVNNKLMLYRHIDKLIQLGYSSPEIFYTQFLYKLDYQDRIDYCMCYSGCNNKLIDKFIQPEVDKIIFNHNRKLKIRNLINK
jgi:hypothetical protein